MKMAIARPRVRALLYTSAMIPVTVPMGALAKMPANRRKTRKAGQDGASAHAMVANAKATKVYIVMSLRPNCSLRGAQRKGPNRR